MIKSTKICKVTRKCLTVTIHQILFPVSFSNISDCHRGSVTSNCYSSSSVVPHLGTNRFNFANTTSDSKIKESTLVLVLRELLDEAVQDSWGYPCLRDLKRCVVNWRNSLVHSLKNICQVYLGNMSIQDKQGKKMAPDLKHHNLARQKRHSSMTQYKYKYKYKYK